MSTEQKIVSETECWIQTVVIGCNFCPFAQRALESGAIHYRVINESQIETCLQMVIDECIYLDSHQQAETSLLIFSQAYGEFDEYLQMLSIAEMLLVQSGYEGVYQLASFHPDYCFDGSSESDPANYTNRSPWPMLHIISEAGLENALQNFTNADEIPKRNVDYARRKGLAHMRSMLDSCRNASEE